MTLSLSFQTDLELMLRVLLAFLLGGLVGLERERHGVSAGIRTYGAICLGACVFGILSTSVAGADPSRIAAQVATGVGFLGGGVIFKQGDSSSSIITGLTTAATLWAIAAVGLAVAFGMYVLSILTSLIIYLMLYLPRLHWWKKIRGR